MRDFYIFQVFMIITSALSTRGWWRHRLSLSFSIVSSNIENLGCFVFNLYKNIYITNKILQDLMRFLPLSLPLLYLDKISFLSSRRCFRRSSEIFIFWCNFQVCWKFYSFFLKSIFRWEKKMKQKNNIWKCSFYRNIFLFQDNEYYWRPSSLSY